jgi:PHD/YefM family antitoxin component YafN of YafNO toxin-antitoxin module
MRQTTTTEFTKNFGQWREVVQREPVAVLSHGRTTGYFISTLEFDELQRLKALSGRSRGIEDLSEKEIDEMMATRMPPEYDHLNSLLKDK